MSADPALTAVQLTKVYGNGHRAVDKVSLNVNVGCTLGIVGESGCGKSTTARMLLRLIEPTSGSIQLEGRDISSLRGRSLSTARRRMQLVPQNPQTSFNPRLTVRHSLLFNLRSAGIPRGNRSALVDSFLDRVALDRDLAAAYPHELSGGQLQRAAIARALLTSPSVIVCDEAVSALDKSVQAQILNLFVEVQRDLGVAYVFISHDLAVVQHISDDVAVMRGGRVVEQADSDSLWRSPAHPYTQELLASVPGGD